MRRVIALLFMATLAQGASRSEVRNGRFYVDGEPFYVRGIGYAAWRPHQRPGVSYAGTNFRYTHRDFERIQAAHFNTIRTWYPLAPEELELADRHGLMVLQGIWLDPRQDFSNPHNQETALAQVEAVARASKDHPNVLGYLLMTRPSPDAVLESGIPETLQFFRRLKRAVQTIDPRPVSMDSWLPLAFMDHNDFDFVTFGAFAFSPRSINHALSYPIYVQWLTKRFGTDRPVLIGQTGGYGVSKATTTAAAGQGVPTEYDQSIKDLESLRGTIQGGALGSVLMSWIDNWSYPRDPDTHDDDPWEWNGVLAIPTEADADGIPRQVLGDVTKFNQLIPIEPKQDGIYDLKSNIALQVFSAKNVATVRYSLNDGDWQPLKGSGFGYWQGFIRLPKLARKRQHITFAAYGPQETPLSRKTISFLTAVLPESVTIAADLDTKKELRFSAAIQDGRGKGIPNRKAYWGFFYPVSLREAQGTAVTKPDGTVSIVCPLTPNEQDRYLYFAVGTESPERIRTGDMRIFKLGS